MFKTLPKWVLAGLVGVVMTLAAAPADADFKIRVSDDLGDTKTMSFTGNFGTFSDSSFFGGHLLFLVAPGVSGIGGAPSQDIAVTAVYDGALGTQKLTVEITQIGFSGLTSPTMTSKASANNDSGISDTFQSWATNNNMEFSHGAFSLGQQGENSVLSGSIGDLTTPFQLGSETIITFTGAGTASIDNGVDVTGAAVPAPAGLVLALTGLPVLAIGRWVRGRSRKTA